DVRWSAAVRSRAHDRARAADPALAIRERMPNDEDPTLDARWHRQGVLNDASLVQSTQHADEADVRDVTAELRSACHTDGLGRPPCEHLAERIDGLVFDLVDDDHWIAERLDARGGVLHRPDVLGAVQSFDGRSGASAYDDRVARRGPIRDLTVGDP